MKDKHLIAMREKNQTKIYSGNSAGKESISTEPTMPLLSDEDFKRLGSYIHENFGIKMPASKKIMLQSRLLRRLRDLGMDNFKIYTDFVLGSGGPSELVNLIDAVTTNKTDFFREPDHFAFLIKTVIPELLSRYGLGDKKKLNIWSAGCSTGEEPYTMAMMLNEYSSGLKYSILATDISSRVLLNAREGIYDESKIEGIPEGFKHKFFLKSKDPSKRQVRVVPEIREAVTFGRLNLMDNDYGFSERMGVIFCRNVIIYFDQPTQRQFLNKLYKCLVPHGYIFMGHSETLSGLDVPLTYAAPTVYRGLR